MLVSASSLSLNERVKNLTFDLDCGECLALLGKSGSGKSSTLELIAGLEKCTSGTVKVEQKVGYLFQNSNLQLFENSVYKEVSFSARKMGLDKKEIEQRVIKALDCVNLDFAKYRDCLPYCLSGGEQKKVALASLLVQDCTLLLFDEPTVGLDKKAKDDFVCVLKNLKKQGKGIIIVSHDLEFVYSLSDKVINLDKGCVTFSGSVEQFANENFNLNPLTRVSKKVLGKACTSFENFIESLVEVKNGLS